MFSREQIVDELKKANENLAHTLLLDLEGNFRAIPVDNCEGYKYLGSISSTDPLDGWVGEGAASDNSWIDKCFLASNKIWTEYQNNRKTYELL